MLLTINAYAYTCVFVLLLSSLCWTDVDVDEFIGMLVDAGLHATNSSNATALSHTHSLSFTQCLILEIRRNRHTSCCQLIIAIHEKGSIGKPMPQNTTAPFRLVVD